MLDNNTEQSIFLAPYNDKILLYKRVFPLRSIFIS